MSNPSALNISGKMLQINGVDIPLNPSSYKVNLQDIDSASATRSANGTMIRDRICGADSAKRKIEIEWQNIDATVAQKLITMIADEYFNVTYFDPYDLGWRTAIFYAGDRKLDMYSPDLGGSGGTIWKSLAYNIIEK